MINLPVAGLFVIIIAAVSIWVRLLVNCDWDEWKDKDDGWP